MAVGGEIASAFVRIRPRTAGFGAEATAGVKAGLRQVQESVKASAHQTVASANEQVAANNRVAQSFRHVATGAEVAESRTKELRATVGEFAKIVGVAFGAEVTFEFFKSIAEHAASIQKQGEVIRSTFGKASETVLEFAEKGAGALGISAHAAETTAARMGILFNNLGVGKDVAAAATVDMLKLAGALSAIRGVDPAIVLKNLPLAIAGNLRSLKQLGIATDQTQLKVAAFKLGLTSSITQALTPSQRALAVVAVATAHLGQYQEQAKKHAGDLANQLRVLASAWDNLKDELGKGLLPTLSVVVAFLAKSLPTAGEKAKTAVKDFAATVGGIAKFIAPALAPVGDIVKAVVSALQGGGGGFGKLRAQFASLTPVAKAATVAVVALGAAIALSLAAAFPVTATIAGILALGIALDEAYKHSARFRSIVDGVRTKIEGWAPAFHRLVAAAQPAFRAIESGIARIPGIVAAAAGAVGKAVNWIAANISKAGPTFDLIRADAEAAFAAVVAIITTAGKGIQKAVNAIWLWVGPVWHVIADAFPSVLRDSLKTVYRLFKDMLKEIGHVFTLIKSIMTGKWSDAWKALKGIISTDLDAGKGLFTGFGHVVGDVFSSLWKSVERISLEGLAKLTAVLAKVPTGFSIFGHFIGLHNPFGKISKDLQGRVDSIDAAKSAKEIADATARNTAAALKAKTRDPAIAVAAGEAAKAVTKKVHAKVTEAITEETNKTTGRASAAAVNAGTAAAEKQLGALKQKLKELIAQNARDIESAVRDAKSNLISIGGTLADQIGQVIDAPFQVAQEKLQAAQDKIALIFDRKNAKLQAESNRLNRLQSQLGLLSDKRSLDQLRAEIALPGGHQLSLDPKKAVQQLERLAKGANQINRPAIDDFILQFRQAQLGVAQDKLGLKQSALDARRQSAETRLQLRGDQLQVGQDASSRLKRLASQNIADLTVDLARGAITLRTFNRKLAKLLEGDHVNYKRAGHLLGSAFASGFRASVQGIGKQAVALDAGPHLPGTGQEPQITRPELTVQKAHLAVSRLQAQIANKQLAIQKKEAAAAAKTADTVAKIHATQLGPTATALGKNPGKSSKKARELEGTTG